MDGNFAVAAARPNGAHGQTGRTHFAPPVGTLPKPGPWPSGGTLGRRHSALRPGFTLVEMLTVIVIIAILASFVTGAVVAARRHAKVVATGLEISQLDAALKAYREKHSQYPPDFAGLAGDATQQAAAKAAVIRHLSTAFPRYIIPGADVNAQWAYLQTALAPYGVTLDAMDPAAALVFWLGGPPETGTNRLVGFSANPKNPFQVGGSRLEALFEFDADRLKSDGNGVLRYFPDIGSGETAPFVYFKAGVGGYDTNTVFAPPAAPVDHTAWGSTRPCLDMRVAGGPAWVKDKSFQIRSAGLDGVFGMGREFPTGTDYDDATLDDQTNFSEGTLEDQM